VSYALDLIFSFLQSSADHLQTTINKLKMQRLTTTITPTPADEEALAKKYLALYTAALPLDAGLPAESLHPADDLGVLAGSVLISAYHLSQSQSYLYTALIVLEKVTSHSKWCYPARLLLVRLNRLLAAPSLAVQHYHNANLKGIQSDTLGHHLLSRAHTFALGSAGDIGLINECVEASQVYTINQNEVRLWRLIRL
jgi:N-terminal acetyltransferase B complex non-catalytic subunit